MSIVCPICKDLLLSVTPNKTSKNIIVTTKCGHLYHSDCLNTFFETPVLHEDGDDTDYIATNTGIFAKSSCPTCQSVVLTKNLIRIYPSEDDNYPLTQLIAESNRLKLQNEELKKENERLTTLNGNIIAFQQRQNTSDESKSTHGLCLQDLVVWFPDQIDSTPEKGIVRWIGLINQTLHAGVEFDNAVGEDANDEVDQVFICKPNHGKIVPVNQLILNSDFQSGSDTLNSDSPSQSKITSKPIPKCTPKPGRLRSVDLDDFEKSFNEFITLSESAVLDYKTLEDETKSLVSEVIVAQPIAIEDQLKRSTSLRSRFIKKEQVIDNLKQLTTPLLKFEDISTDEISIIQVYIASLEQIRGKCKENLKLAREKFNTALGHSQKVKSFVDAGSWWLNNLQVKFEILMQQKEKLSTAGYS